MQTKTLAQVTAEHKASVYDYLDTSAEVPVITEAAAQGDVLFVKQPMKPSTTPIPATGAEIIRGANGHAHTLFAAPGAAFYTPSKDLNAATNLQLGTLTVSAGQTAAVIHQEHGAFEFSGGDNGASFYVGAQRDFQGEWVQAAD